MPQPSAHHAGQPPPAADAGTAADALPQFFTGLKIAVTYAYSAAIVAEFVGAQQGLGVYMTTAIRAAPIRTDLVLGAVFVIALLTITLFAVVGVIERLAMPWSHRP